MDRRSHLPVAFSAAFLAVSLLLVATPTTSALSPAPTIQNRWAFGAERTVSASGTTWDGLTYYSSRAFLGWHTVLAQTNLSGSEFEVDVNRTMGASLFVNYCRPSCENPIGTENISGRAWQTLTAASTISNNGTVHTQLGTASALAIVNTRVTLRSNLTETVSATWHGSRGLTTASGVLYVEGAATMNVSFSPALGLAPLDLGSAPWNATSTYRASGAWSISLHGSKTDFAGTTSTQQLTWPGNVSASGPVTVYGQTVGSRSLSDGTATTAAALHVVGPFSAWEGFVMIPGGAELFHLTSTTKWYSNASGTMTASTDTVDFGARGLPHVPILASATTYAPSSTDWGGFPLSPTLALMATPGGLTTAATAFDGPAPTSIQGQPESVSAATLGAQCLLAPCPGPHTSTSRSLGGLVAIGVVAVLAVAVGAVMLRRQPPREVPPSPNAERYPPPPPRAIAPRLPNGSRPPPGPSEDPLSHLW